MTKPVKDSIKLAQDLNTAEIEQLPFADASVSADYDAKVKKVLKLKSKRFGVSTQISKISEQDPINEQNLIKKIQANLRLCREIDELVERVENEEDNDLEAQAEEVAYLYEQAVELFEGREVDSRETDDCEENFEYLMTFKGRTPELEEELSELEAREMQHTMLLEYATWLEKKISTLENDIRIIRENALKGMKAEGNVGHATTLPLEGKSDVRIDYSDADLERLKENKDLSRSE